MKTMNGLAAVVCATGLALQGIAVAQDPATHQAAQRQTTPTVQRPDVGEQVSQDRQQLISVGGENLPQGLFRADELEDIDLFNAQNEEIGEIEDVVIDSKTGKIAYVAAEVGEGLLGVGGKMIALPWNALQFTHLKGDPEDAVVVLRGDRQTLENAPEIAEDRIWPFSAAGGQTEQAEPTEQALAGRNLPHGLFRADELEGTDLFNAKNEELGEIEEVVINAMTGTVEYVAVEVGGGFLGIGEDLVAVPWDSIRLTHKEADPDDLVGLMNVDRQTMENAPKIEGEVWPATAQADWLTRAPGTETETERRQARQPGEEPVRQ